jgi:NAD(P)-binding Rossmann-like domain
MDTTPLETDYLVVGAGAASMAFVDTLLDESDARVVMVDRRDRPGGHWNDAYPFVRLHQPSAYYGVGSRALGHGVVDATGLNRGMQELASGAEVLDYYDQVMSQRFLPSGRVEYVPMADLELTGGREGTITSLLTGETRRVSARRKVVDGTLSRTEVPATHPPKYEVAAGVTCIPLNGLPRVARPRSGYVVVGSGKSGIDACLWLLDRGVDPDRVRWIMPRDAWMLDRQNFQTRPEDFERHIGAFTGELQSIVEATSAADLFARLEARGLLLRLDPKVEPTMYRCCTVSQTELSALRRLRHVVRLGRVIRVTPREIVMDQGAIPSDPGELVVDCSAAGLRPPPLVPVFDGDRINLMTVRTCQPTFSAALVGYIESHLATAAEQNACCRPSPVPNVPADWMRMWWTTIGNRVAWAQNPALSAWLARSRLDSLAIMARTVEPHEAHKLALLEKLRATMGAAAFKLPVLMEGMG